MFRKFAKIPSGPPKLEMLDLLRECLGPGIFGDQNLPDLQADENEFAREVVDGIEVEDRRRANPRRE
jgi:hypothetical protein